MTLFLLAAYGFACAAVYHVCPARFRWVALLAVSYGFYASRSLLGLPFILTTTLTTWLGARIIGKIGEASRARLREGKASLSPDEKKKLKAEAKAKQRAWMLGTLLLNFGLLAVLKYTDDVRGWFGREPLGLLLPLGISFYTFQSMGYLLDVYNGKYAPERNPARFALFVSFFPQLIQGPIGRYDRMKEQFEAGGAPVNVEKSALLMLWGLFKKMVIADRALPLVSAVFSENAGEWGGAVTVLGVLAYSLQQYCDFSGGIDLVAGIAELFGIRLAENFKRPYFAVSLGDFWRRWHISLGAWMRDYVFYPFALCKPVARLSKDAKKVFGASFARALPAALGNLLVFLLVGVWHGATSNYILWGLYNGVILAFTALMEPTYKRMNESLPRLTASKGFHVFRVLRTFVIVNIGWFFDRCAHAADAFGMLGTVVSRPKMAQLSMETLQKLGVSAVDARVLAAGTLLLFAVSLTEENGKDIRGWLAARALPIRWAILMTGVLAVLLMGVWGSGFSEASFIYFNF